MRNILLLLLISVSVSAQTKYRVYLKTGTVEFLNQTKANYYATVNNADSVVAINYDAFAEQKELAQDSVHAENYKAEVSQWYNSLTAAQKNKVQVRLIIEAIPLSRLKKLIQ